jgi:uncharacterized coiled-coil protein SlyX
MLCARGKGANLTEAGMPTIEERLAFLEGQMSELSHGLVEVRDAVRQLDQTMDARFVQVDERFAQVDARFAQVDARFIQVDARFDSMDRRFATLDDKVSRQFVWTVGVQVTTLVAIVGALLSRG